jgi:predicted TIM-barrel fold metal-dependent hydrolase
MKIVDAHHHFWDPIRNDHPWLSQQPPIAFRYGDYSALRRPFMPPDYDELSSRWDVIASITMEGEWNPADPTGEARWMQNLHDEIGRPVAHVAQAWLDRDDLEQVLRTYRRLPLVRSVRHKPRANPAPGGPPGGMTCQSFLEGFRRLSDEGLMFDLQTPWWHLFEAENLSLLAPHVPIILNHAGLPSDRSASGLAAWRDALMQFAVLPNTFIKISGLGLAGRPWQIQENLVIIQDCITIFGPRRAMFASNFPVDGLCGSFDTIFSGFDQATTNLPAADRDLLFYDTALAVYGMT